MANVLSLPLNTKGRDFVVGDIHGTYPLLESALQKVNFDPSCDRLICVGDLIDRGPQSLRCLEYLAKPWFFSLRGNHEDMFLGCWNNGNMDWEEATFHIQRNGMAWIQNLNPDQLDLLGNVFSGLPIAMEVETPRGVVGFVHAEVPKGMDWQTFLTKIRADDNHTVQTALWGRDRIGHGDTSGVPGIDRIFFGHTPQDSGARRLGNCYYIDTGAVFGSLYGDEAPEYHMTMLDVTAQTQRIAQPVSGKERIRVIAEPGSKQPFGRYNL